MAREASIAERLRASLDRLTPTERRAAATLLGHYPMAGLESVTQFARRAGVSAPSILRLLGKLGFSGYPEFQEGLREELAARLESPLGRLRESHPREGEARDFLPLFAERVVDNLRGTVEHLPSAAFDRIVGLLCDERHRVHFLGGRFTGHLAGYMAAHLRAVRAGVHEVSGHGATWPDMLLSVGRRDAVLVFDVRRYQPDVRSFAERAVARGARVVLFTDEWNSPIAAVAEHVVLSHTATRHGWDSLAGLLVVAEALIAAVSDRLGPRSAERLRELEELRSGWGGSLPEPE
ncbi:MurR/RpiR family transcriptional regulator [Arenibaculum sp.]|jgi:DNA-binding MurR/RpiR family transcriptional regulator|uniref:MurR/RpiR family transcriptional regulator n=1 Tax=Arenibaculum sp. TaxID=2865862 RepID=UPI002E0DED7D|nr:MurR/RpiR family transcriptional regulator [Arenibaculum sp.]